MAAAELMKERRYDKWCTNVILVGLVIAGLSKTKAAWAQAASTKAAATQLDEIVVTARRVEEPLSNVPESVSVVRSRGIDIEAPTNAAVDISRRVPNYAVTDVGNPLFAFGAIRGVGTLSFPQNPFDSTIGYALNGNPISLYAGTQQLLDVQRVAVVRGPQNVLYGRASEGGTVNIVASEPDGVRDIRIRSEMGTKKNYLTDVIAGGTILPDVLNGRGAVRFTGSRGEVTNLIGGEKLPDSQIGAARGSLRLFAGDRTTITAHGLYERDRNDTYNYILRDGPDYPAASLDQPLGFKRNLTIGSVEVKHELDRFDVIGTFGIQDIHSKFGSDNTDGLVYSQITGLPPSAFVSPTCSDCTRYNFDERTYSGEIRATSRPNAPVRWVAGLSTYQSRFEQGGINTSSFGPTQNGTYDAKLDLQSYSGFAEVGIPFADRWTLTPGARVGRDTMARAGAYVSNGTAGTVPQFDEFGKVTSSYIAGGPTLSYKVNDTSLVYGSVKRGYSNAGFAYFNIDAVFGKAVPSYPASFAWTYELGGRTALLGGRLTVDGAMFFNDVKDGHVNFFDLRADQFAIAALDYRTYGAEVSTRFKLTDISTLYANAGYTRAVFADVPSTDTTGAKDGNLLPGIPTLSGLVGIENRLPLGPYGLLGDLTTLAELQFTAGRRPADIANTFDLRPYRIVNARIGWEMEKYRIYCFGRNLTNQIVELAGTPFTPQVFAVTPGLGRVVGVGGEVIF